MEEKTEKTLAGRPATGKIAVRYCITLPPEVAEKLPKKGASRKIQAILRLFYKIKSK